MIRFQVNIFCAPRFAEDIYFIFERDTVFFAPKNSDVTEEGTNPFSLIEVDILYTALNNIQ